MAGRVLGDGVGAACPVCPEWFDSTMHEWAEHYAAEHPREWARTQAAARSSVGAERMMARAEVSHDLTAAAHRSKQSGRRAA